ncbi:Soyasaponin III rhamnosyltransferase [Stylosanthes scabra]|uniref:Soyasaponin III rhamnosyltransferase n=1 Tax=Stylosanthes scabra TaxID=79078 RepID=A0ABU6VPM7_9FABA|nr:Soyasaponin III rhamnosyltransferase [Stylosanthes scabra]
MDSTAPIHCNGNGNSNRPLHVAMLPWLAMGHIYPYFELAKILAQHGHTVTFINSPRNIDRMPKAPKSLEPFIKIVKLPLPQVENLPEGVESTMDIAPNMVCYLKQAYEGLQEPVEELLKSSKPDWVFYDFAAGWLPAIARRLNIPCAHYNITPAWNKGFFDRPQHLMDSITLESIVSPPTWLPFKTTMHFKLYEFMRALESIKNEKTGEPDKFDLKKAYSSSDLFLLRTSRELEAEWLDYIADLYNIPVVPVGLLPPSMQIRDSEEEENNPDWVQIKEWLDSQTSSSVVYIGFGSELKLSQEDLTELAYGIELSGLPFFWALKNLKEGSLELPQGFEDRTKDRGIVWKTWAPQLKILAHAAIGGCMSHCGSGSVIEKLHFGHVLVTLPYLLDQALFSRALVEKQVAIETLRLAIVDEEGKSYRENAKEMGKVFSSKELHEQYIEDFIAALHKYRKPSN